jgi:hypothetical protein
MEIAPTADELKAFLGEALRNLGQWTPNISLKAEPLTPEEIEQLPISSFTDGPPLPETETIGFLLHVRAHRMARSEADEALHHLRDNVCSVLSNQAMFLAGSPEYEGCDPLSELDEDADQLVFSSSFSVYLGAEGRPAQAP